MYKCLNRVFFAFFAFFCISPSMADQAYLTLENDTFLKKADNDYTHGTEFKYIKDNGWQFKVQQNMYTPSDIKVKEHIKGDRPYAGMLIGGIGKELFIDAKSPWSHYLEINAGVIGRASGAEQAQKMIHKILGCNKPMGWHNQLHNEVVVNGQWWTKYNWFLCDYVAIVPRGGIAVGTIQDFVDIGVDVKIGWNMRRKDVGNSIMFSATRNSSWKDKLSFWAYGGIGERYYLYNHMLEGSMFNNKDDHLKVDIEPFVTEARVGVVLQYDKFFATWYGVFRTDEFDNQPNSPDYGGITIGWLW